MAAPVFAADAQRPRPAVLSITASNCEQYLPSLSTPTLMSSLTQDSSPEDFSRTVTDDFFNVYSPAVEVPTGFADYEIGLVDRNDDLSPFSRDFPSNIGQTELELQIQQELDIAMKKQPQQDPVDFVHIYEETKEHQLQPFNPTIAPSLLTSHMSANYDRHIDDTAVQHIDHTNHLSPNSFFDQTSIDGDGSSVWSGTSGVHSTGDYANMHATRVLGVASPATAVSRLCSPFAGVPSNAPTPRPASSHADITTAVATSPSINTAPLIRPQIVIPTMLPVPRPLKRKRPSLDEDDEEYVNGASEGDEDYAPRRRHFASPSVPPTSFNFVAPTPMSSSTDEASPQRKKARRARRGDQSRPSADECLGACETLQALTRGTSLGLASSSSPQPAVKDEGTPSPVSSRSKLSVSSSSPFFPTTPSPEPAGLPVNMKKLVSVLPPLPSTAKSCPICGHAPTRKAKSNTFSSSHVPGYRVSRSDLKRHYETHLDKRANSGGQEGEAKPAGYICRLCTPVTQDSVSGQTHVVVLDPKGEKEWRDGMALGDKAITLGRIRYVPFSRMDCAQRHWTNVHERAFGGYINDEHFTKAVLRPEDARLVEEMSARRGGRKL